MSTSNDAYDVFGYVLSPELGNNPLNAKIMSISQHNDLEIIVVCGVIFS